MTHRIELPEVELAPEPPPHGPRVWLARNLFSTPASAVLTVVFSALAVLAIRGMLAFIFAPERQWDAVTFNTKLLMTDAYPYEQFFRVWLSVGIVVVLLAATFAVYRIGGQTTPRNAGMVLASIGGFALVCGILGPWGIQLSPVSVQSPWTFTIWVVVSVVVLAFGLVLRNLPGDRSKAPVIPMMGVVLLGVMIVVTLMWTIDLPYPSRDAAGDQITILAPIATSTTVPWTVLAAIGVGVYLLVKLICNVVPERLARTVMVSAWALSFPVVVLVILRDPGLDYSRVLTWYIPVALGFIVVGGVILNFVANTKGELGRIIGALLLILAFVAFLISTEFVVRWLLLGLALFALAAPSFGGEGGGRRVFLTIWATLVVVVVFFVMMLSAPSTVEVAGNRSPFGGLTLTIVLAVVSIVLSFPIGVVLALGRTSKLPLFRLMSTAYIELVRGVPLITWLIVAFILLPVALPSGVEIKGVARAIGAMTFFSAAYLAENVRGGLQAIPKGQYEASAAMGLSTVQTTAFIVLPQALRAVIPALVGQVISLFKDTSLVTIVGLADFLHIARSIIPNQTQPYNFLGAIKEPLLYAAVVYWLFTFTFSRISQRLERRLGVGER